MCAWWPKAWLVVGMLMALWLSAAAVGAEPKGPSLVTSGMDVGLGRFRSQNWGLLTCDIKNPSARNQDFLSSSFCDIAAQVQFARTVWVPAGCHRKIWLPVHIPDLARDARQVDVTSLLVAGTGAGETLLDQQPTSLVVDTRRVGTALAADGVRDDSAMDFATAVRQVENGDTHLIALRMAALPPMELGYEGLDQLVLAKGATDLDTAQAQALRRWVEAGGHVWLMLESVQPEVVAALLGPSGAALETVDRIELNDFVIQGPGSNQPVTVEQPVSLVRVLATGMEVTHRVNGWPAALRMRLGRGLVVVTTLGSSAWLDGKKATPALAAVAAEFMSRRKVDTLATLPWDGFLRDQIGYRVLSRSVVGGILVAFCIALLAGGIWLRRIQRQELAGIVFAVLALGFGVLLVGLGWSNREETPATLVVGGAGEAVTAQGAMELQGKMQVYLPRGAKGEIECADDLLLWPENSKSNARMIWTDLDRYHWQNVNFPAGAVYSATLRQTIRLGSPVSARLSFGPQGVTGTVRAPALAPLADTLLATPVGNLEPRWLSDTQFVAGSEQTLAAGQYIAATLAGDEQNRHRLVYQDLFAPQSAPAAASRLGGLARTGELPLRESYHPDEPVLLGWTTALAPSVLLTVDVRRLNRVLVAIPLEIERPAPGTKVVVPSAFLPFHLQRGPRPATANGRPQGSATGSFSRLSTIYDAKSRTWIPITQSGVAEIRFVPPSELLPLQVDALRLKLDVRAPGRTVKVFWAGAGDSGTGRESHTLLTQQDMLRMQEITVSGRPADQLAPGQDVRLLLEVGEANTAAGGVVPMWVVKSLNLELAGTTLPGTDTDLAADKPR